MIRFAIGLGWAALLVWLILPRSQEHRALTPILTLLLVFVTLMWAVSFR